MPPISLKSVKKWGTPWTPGTPQCITGLKHKSTYFPVVCVGLTVT